MAYFFRAYFYYEKVLRYGDVPWYEQVIGSEEEELLKKPREDRGIIMDHVMNDLKNAIEMLPREKDVARVTRWSALALKSRIALYEGTWRKYRNLPDADKYLQLAADAASTFISESGYSLYKEGTEPYRDLFCSDDAKQEEVILARIYNFEGLNLSHNVQFNIRNSAAGFTRRFMNHYLMADVRASPKKRDTKRCPTPKRPPDATPVWHRPYSVRATSPKARSRSRRTT